MPANKTNKPKRAITHRSGKKRNRKMLASEKRKKDKEDWENYHNDWMAYNQPGVKPGKKKERDEDLESNYSSDALPIDMVDEEYNTDNLAFIDKLEEKNRKFELESEDEDARADGQYQSLPVRGADGELVSKTLKKVDESEVEKIKNSEKSRKGKKRAKMEELKKEAGENEDPDVKEEAVSGESSDEEPEGPKSTIELLQIRQQKINKKKLFLMKFSENIVTDPTNLGYLKQLKKLVQSIKDKNILFTDPEIGLIYTKYTILTCCEIFCNILPNYVIHDRSGYEEPKVRISKEVKNKWDVDEATLGAYFWGGIEFWRLRFLKF